MGRLNKFDIHDIHFIAEPSKWFIIINIKCYLLDSWIKKVFLLKIIIFKKRCCLNMIWHLILLHFGNIMISKNSDIINNVLLADSHNSKVLSNPGVNIKQ